jgi:hypothetical protein
VLDMFQSSFDREAAPQANEGRDLPATFGESFQDAWSNGQLATSGIKQDNARTQAIQEYTDKINAASGGAVDAEYSKQLAENQGLTTVDASSGGPDPLEVANGVVAKLKAGADAAGRALPFTPMSSDDIDTRAAQISQQAIATNAAMQAKPQTWGSWAGKTAGALASGSVDPYNIPLYAIPLEGLGVAATALAFGAGSALTQTAREAANSDFNEKVQPGYQASGQAMGNIAEAGVSGAVMGGGGALLGVGIKALGGALTRAATGAWPTAAKDAANGVMSEANILDTNALHGAEGEAAHQGALGQSIDQILREAPVDVSRDIPAESGFARTIGDIPTEAAPPQEPDTVRYYHGSKEGADVGSYPAWITPSEDYARNFRSGDVPNDVSYVDIPKDHPEISGETAPGYDAINNFYQNFQASEDLSSGLRPLESPAAAEPAAAEVRAGSLTPDQISEQLAAPEAMNAMRADVERAIDEAAQSKYADDGTLLSKGKVLQIPVGVDQDGEPIWGSAASALDEVDRMNALADQIAACVTPMALAAE